MSSGEKRLVSNTRERVLSVDANRTQSFIARARSQLARFQYNDVRQNTYQYPGVSTQQVGGEVPLAGDVYGGLMVDPLTTSVLVQPGMLGCLFPDPAATADDSPYMLIESAGQPTAGVLTFTANASGQIRIDLVECQPVAVTLESDNRDIFNPATGLFSPALIPKVQAWELQYRIRVGVGGSGVPALVADWLPLAAIVVPSGAGDFSTCDFFDVRPLVEERVDPQPAYDSTGTFVDEQFSPLRHASYQSQVDTGATLVAGYSESRFGGYKAGGWLRRSSPSFSGSFTGVGIADGDPDFINCSLAENQTTGFTYAANAIRYLHAFFPSGLPRWVRYSHSAVGGGFGRIPKGPRGIVLVSNGGASQNGIASLITIGHGFTAPAPGVLLGTLVCNTGGTDFIGVMAQDGMHRLAAVGPNSLATRTSGSTVFFAPAAGNDYPAAATELLVQLLLKFNNTDTVVDPGQLKVHVNNNVTPSIGSLVTPGDPLPVGVGTTFATITLVVPILASPNPRLITSSLSTLINLTYTSQLFIGNVTLDAAANIQTMNIIGWRLG